MNLRKWRIADALERGADAEARRKARTPELRTYLRALTAVDQRLEAEAGDIDLNAPPHLAPRIIESIRESHRLQASEISGSFSVSRPLFALGSAAVLAAALTAAVYLGSPSGTQTEPTQVADAVVNEMPARLSLDPSAAILPVGRVVVERVESPLHTEAQLLRRDTQRMTDMVISSLPFAPGSR